MNRTITHSFIQQLFESLLWARKVIWFWIPNDAKASSYFSFLKITMRNTLIYSVENNYPNESVNLQSCLRWNSCENPPKVPWKSYLFHWLVCSKTDYTFVRSYICLYACICLQTEMSPRFLMLARTQPASSTWEPDTMIRPIFYL